MRCFARIALLFVAANGCKGTAPKSVQLEDISPARVGRQQEAIEKFTADRGEAEFHAAVDNWEQGELDACQERLRGILSRQPHHVAAALLLAETHFALDKTDAAAETLQSIASGPLATNEDRQAAAVLALRYNQPKLAADLVRSPGRTPPSAELLCTQGLAYYRCGDYAAAEAALDQALRLDNPPALAYFLMGCTQSRMGKKSQADVAFAQATRIDARFTVAR